MKRIPFSLNAQAAMPGKSGMELCSIPYSPGQRACLKGFILQAQPVSDTGQFVWLAVAGLQFWLDTSTSDVTSISQSFPDGCIIGDPTVQIVPGADTFSGQFLFAVSGQNAVSVELNLNAWGWYEPTNK